MYYDLLFIAYRYHSSSSLASISVKVNNKVFRSSEIFWFPFEITLNSSSCYSLASSLPLYSSWSILLILRF